MTERTHYSNAPITEAIIDMRVIQAQGFSIDDLAAIQEVEADRYPNRQSEVIYSGRMYIEEAEGPLQTESAHQQTGFRLVSQDKRETFIARLDGFVYSIQAPYDRWETFRDEARRLWGSYLSVSDAVGVTRAAVRYINQLNFPGAEVEMKDYLRTVPEVSPDFPHGGLAGFFMQLQIPQPDLECMLILNEAPTQAPNPETTSILLDFDLFRERFDRPWKVDENNEVWEFMERLHQRKNEVFEASITEKTRRLIR